MKKVFYLLVVGLLLVLTGCGAKEKPVTYIDYPGIYEQGNEKIYIVAMNQKELRYYVQREGGYKYNGYLKFKNGQYVNDEFDEVVKVKLVKGDLVVETENFDYFSDGVFKRIGDFTLDEYFNETYGRLEYFDSKYSGKFKNNDGMIYIYQPDKDYVEFEVEMPEASVGCEVNLNELTDDDLVCTIFEDVYTLKIDGDKLTYTADTENEDDKYSGEFMRDGKLTKEDVIDKFQPFGMFD